MHVQLKLIDYDVHQKSIVLANADGQAPPVPASSSVQATSASKKSHFRAQLELAVIPQRANCSLLVSFAAPMCLTATLQRLALALLRHAVSTLLVRVEPFVAHPKVCAMPKRFAMGDRRARPMCCIRVISRVVQEEVNVMSANGAAVSMRSARLTPKRRLISCALRPRPSATRPNIVTD